MNLKLYALRNCFTDFRLVYIFLLKNDFVKFFENNFRKNENATILFGEISSGLIGLHFTHEPNNGDVAGQALGQAVLVRSQHEKG